MENNSFEMKEMDEINEEALKKTREINNELILRKIVVNRLLEAYYELILVNNLITNDGWKKYVLSKDKLLATEEYDNHKRILYLSNKDEYGNEILLRNKLILEDYLLDKRLEILKQKF